MIFVSINIAKDERGRVMGVYGLKNTNYFLKHAYVSISTIINLLIRCKFRGLFKYCIAETGNIILL